jgi:hypothetical protein
MHALMSAITPLHPGPARFEGGLTEVGPGVHAWLQPNGLLAESNAALVVGDGVSLLVDTLWDLRLTRRTLAATKRAARAAVTRQIEAWAGGALTRRDFWSDRYYSLWKLEPRSPGAR